MEKFMGRMSILTILLLIASIVCDDNNVTTPLSSTPLTSSTTASISVTSSTTTAPTTVAPQTSENATKPAQIPSPPTSTLSSNRKQQSQCNCDLTVTKFKRVREKNYAHISFISLFSLNFIINIRLAEL
jgi:hypothetical protein